MKRPKFEEICGTIANVIKERSTCSRLKVGCVITTTDFRKILSWGYNGNAQSLPNRCDTTIPGKCGCLHAECNAVINCDSPRHVPKYVFITHMPCVQCSKIIINLGNVETVFYEREYRSKEALRLFKKAGIKVKKNV